MEEKKKSNVGLIILVVVLLLACAGMGAFIFINRDKLMSNENNATTETLKEVTDDNKEKEKYDELGHEITNPVSFKYCEGTYTYNDNIPVGDGELHKQVITLKKDGTFNGSSNDTTKEEGTYIIEDDTIVFVYHPETYGGTDNASYTSKSYYISSDCSYMSYEHNKMDGNPVRIKLTK